MPKKKKRTYYAKPTAQFDKSKVQVYGEELQRIKDKHNGFATPHIIVGEAKTPESPIHECFEWDDKKAGECWRIEQARDLEGHIEVEIETKEGPKRTRAFVNLSIRKADEEKKENVYMSVEKAMKDDYYRYLYLKQAMKEMIVLKQKYSDLNELSQIFSAIDAVQARLDFKFEEGR